MPKVNYLIAAAAHREYRPQSEFRVKGADILRLHLEQLALTDTSKLAQITLIRIWPDINNIQLSNYWSIDEQVEKLKCPFVILDVPNECISYGAYIRAVQKYQNNFDYYVIMEDDYYPVLPDFVDILLNLHNKFFLKGGYLNSLTAREWAAISNGIIDSQTFLNAINKVKDPISFVAKAPQINFSYLFAPNLADYLDYYRSLFMRFEGQILWEEYRELLGHTQDLINPIEYLIQKDLDFPKNRWDKTIWSDKIMNDINQILEKEK